jgi:hypothetical protein
LADGFTIEEHRAEKENGYNQEDANSYKMRKYLCGEIDFFHALNLRRYVVRFRHSITSRQSSAHFLF